MKFCRRKSRLGREPVNSEALANASFGALSGLKSDVAPGLKSANKLMFRPGRFGRPLHPSTMLRNVPTFDQQVASRVGCTDSLSP